MGPIIMNGRGQSNEWSGSVLFHKVAAPPGQIRGSRRGFILRCRQGLSLPDRVNVFHNAARNLCDVVLPTSDPGPKKYIIGDKPVNRAQGPAAACPMVRQRNLLLFTLLGTGMGTGMGTQEPTKGTKELTCSSSSTGGYDSNGRYRQYCQECTKQLVPSSGIHKPRHLH